MLDHLFDNLVSTLCQFPRSSRLFFDHPARSLETRAARRRLRRYLESGDELRAFILDDYLLLYLVRWTLVTFLAIKHHRLLSFDLHRF